MVLSWTGISGCLSFHSLTIFSSKARGEGSLLYELKTIGLACALAGATPTVFVARTTMATSIRRVMSFLFMKKTPVQELTLVLDRLTCIPRCGTNRRTD